MDNVDRSRRDLLKSVGLKSLGVAGIFSTGLTGTESINARILHGDNLDISGNHDSWSVAVLPDTQSYVSQFGGEPREKRLERLKSQTQYVAEDNNFVFATQLGDLVNNGDSFEQFRMVSERFDALDDEIVYGVLPGNHDYKHTDDKDSGLELYNEFFGAERFESYDWFNDWSLEEPLTSQKFSVGDLTVRNISMPWEPLDSTLEEVKSRIENDPVPTMISKHGNIVGHPLMLGRTSLKDSERGNSPQEVYEKLIGGTEEIFMVNSGHFYKDYLGMGVGESARVTRNEVGKPLIEILSNFQDLKYGGNGYMREIEFIEDGGSREYYPDLIKISSYSPFLDKYKDGRDSHLGVEIDFEDIF